LKRLEYSLYGLPGEDLVIYLRLPAARAQQLVARKSSRKYTRLRRDILEDDVQHLEEAAAIYDQLGRQPNWVTIECVDTVGAVRPPQEIAPVIWAAVEPFLVQSAAAVQAAKLSGTPRVS
jgi:thymidylate kinase